jgi:hypothetical protein
MARRDRPNGSDVGTGGRVTAILRVSDLEGGDAMLRARVRLARSVSRKDQAHAYAVALTGDVPFTPDDAEGVLEKVAELFHLAEEALAREVERGQEDCPTRPQHMDPNPQPGPSPAVEAPRRVNSDIVRPEDATPKQVWYLLSLGKRRGLSRDTIDAVIARVVGRPKKARELTKREAGQVIDHLNNLEPEQAK